MNYHEKLGTKEYIRARAAVFGLAGAMALAACSSTTAPEPLPRPSATRSTQQTEGCVELMAINAGASPKAGTTYELSLIGIWRSAIVVGERLTFIRLGRNPVGPGNRIQTPVIGIDQGRLPSIMHTFPPTSTPEKFLVEGVAIGEGNRLLPGECETEITIVPVYTPQGPQPPITLMGA